MQPCSSSAVRPDYAGALALFEDACASADIEVLEGALATLDEMTRRGGDHNADLTLAAYVAKLRQYPADVVLFVLNRWPDDNEFWPTWKRLKEKLDLFAWRRRVVMDALQHEIGKSPGRGA